MERRKFMAGLATLGALPLVGGRAWADGGVLQGGDRDPARDAGAGPGAIDPQIGNLPQLKKPPFSAYNTYKLVSRTSVPLEKGKPQTHTMVNKRVLQVTLIDTTRGQALPRRRGHQPAGRQRVPQAARGDGGGERAVLRRRAEPRGRHPGHRDHHQAVT